MVAWGFLWTQLLTNYPKLFLIFRNEISACGVLRCRHQFKLNSFVFILINGHSTFPGILSVFYSSRTLLPCIVWQLARLIPGSSQLEGRGVPEAGHTQFTHVKRHPQHQQEASRCSTVGAYVLKTADQQTQSVQAIVMLYQLFYDYIYGPDAHDPLFVLTTIVT